MDIKEGYKTTEFWLALVSQLIGIAVLFGYISGDMAVEVEEALDSLVVAVFALIAVASQIVPAVYVWGRSKLKASA